MSRRGEKQRPWTMAERARIRRWLELGGNVHDIALFTGRTVHAIRCFVSNQRAASTQLSRCDDIAQYVVGRP